MFHKHKHIITDLPPQMDDTTTQEEPKKPIPFNNLYLVSGLVHGFNKSWMYVFTVLLLVFGYLLFQSLVVFPLMNVLMDNGYTLGEIQKNSNLLFDSTALKMDKNLVLLLELGMFVFGFIGFFIGVKYFHHKPFTSILTGYEKFRFGRFGFAFLVWSLLLITGVLGDYYLNPDEISIQYDTTKQGELSFNYLGLIISVFIMVLFMPIQTGLEEFVFRGYLVQGLSQIFKNGYVPLIITSLLFGLAHMSNPEVKAYGWPIMLSYFCGFALFMGALTLLDEGLELAFGIHFANNFISSILISSPNSVIKTYSIFQTKTENPYAEMVMWVIMATLTFVIFWLKYRWKNFSLILK